MVLKLIREQVPEIKHSQPTEIFVGFSTKRYHLWEDMTRIDVRHNSDYRLGGGLQFITAL